MPGLNLLTKLRIGEVSSVDRGAGHGVRIVLMKRMDGESPYADFEKSGLADAVVEYLKREFSADQRKELTTSGKAMPDGGFPIENTSDLANAIQAIGRASNPKAAKQHIISRARALGAMDKIPEEWTKTQPAKKVMTQAAIDIAKAASAAGIAMPIVKRATDALWKVIDSAAYGDHGSANAVSGAFSDCIEHLAKRAPALASAAFISACNDAVANISKGDDDMTPQEIEALVTKAVGTATASMQSTIDKQAETIAVMGMSDKARKHYETLATDDLKKAFKAKKPAEQDADADDEARKAIAKSDLPPAVKEMLKRFDGVAAENVELKKRLDGMTEAQTIVEFGKRAIGLGLVEADGEIMRKAYSGDAEAQKKLDQKIAALSRQANPALFAELGKAGGGAGAKAYDQFVAKAEELRKTADGSKLSPQQAFNKVFTDPANKALADQHRQEEMGARRAA